MPPPQSSQSQPLLFVYRHSAVRSEADDLRDAVLLFSPPETPLSRQCLLAGQLMGLTGFVRCGLLSQPAVFELEDVRLACVHAHDLTLCVGVASGPSTAGSGTGSNSSSSGSSDAALVEATCRLARTFQLLAGPLPIAFAGARRHSPELEARLAPLAARLLELYCCSHQHQLPSPSPAAPLLGLTSGRVARTPLLPSRRPFPGPDANVEAHHHQQQHQQQRGQQQRSRCRLLLAGDCLAERVVRCCSGGVLGCAVFARGRFLAASSGLSAQLCTAMSLVAASLAAGDDNSIDWVASEQLVGLPKPLQEVRNQRHAENEVRRQPNQENEVRTQPNQKNEVKRQPNQVNEVRTQPNQVNEVRKQQHQVAKDVTKQQQERPENEISQQEHHQQQQQQQNEANKQPHHQQSNNGTYRRLHSATGGELRAFAFQAFVSTEEDLLLLEDDNGQVAYSTSTGCRGFCRDDSATVASLASLCRTAWLRLCDAAVASSTGTAASAAASVRRCQCISWRPAAGSSSAGLCVVALVRADACPGCAQHSAELLLTAGELKPLIDAFAAAAVDSGDVVDGGSGVGGAGGSDDEGATQQRQSAPLLLLHCPQLLAAPSAAAIRRHLGGDDTEDGDEFGSYSSSEAIGVHIADIVAADSQLTALAVRVDGRLRVSAARSSGLLAVSGRVDLAARRGPPTASAAVSVSSAPLPAAGPSRRRRFLRAARVSLGGGGSGSGGSGGHLLAPPPPPTSLPPSQQLLQLPGGSSGSSPRRSRSLIGGWRPPSKGV